MSPTEMKFRLLVLFNAFAGVAWLAVVGIRFPAAGCAVAMVGPMTSAALNMLIGNNLRNRNASTKE